MSERAEPDELGHAPDAEPVDFEPQAAQRDDDSDDFPGTRRIVPAASAAPLVHVVRLRAPVSIFSVETAAGLLARCRAGQVRPPEPLYVPRVEREFGIVRLVRVRVEETAAWRVKEEARRAKQRPPKPCAAMRRRKSEKLRKLLGLDLDQGD